MCVNYCKREKNDNLRLESENDKIRGPRDEKRTLEQVVIRKPNKYEAHYPETTTTRETTQNSTF